MDVVAFSQRDPRWAGRPLGSGALSIGQAGCLISAVASMLASWGVPTDPGRINDFVLQASGFVDGNLFVFASVDGLGCRFAEYVRCMTTPAPMERLYAAIAGGQGVVACVDATPGGRVDQHWVWLYAAPGTPTPDGVAASWQIVDPWRLPGYGRIDLSSYLASGWTPARGIFAAAIYDRVTAARWFAQRDTPTHQEAVCVRGAAEGAGDG